MTCEQARGCRGTPLFLPYDRISNDHMRPKAELNAEVGNWPGSIAARLGPIPGSPWRHTTVVWIHGISLGRESCTPTEIGVDDRTRTG